MEEAICKKYFSKSSWSRLREFCSAVRFTLLGVKPALLIDCLPPDVDKIQLFLQEVLHLRRSDPQRNGKVFLLTVGDDVLIINSWSLSRLVRTASPIFVDVTKGKSKPTIMAEPMRQSLLERITCSLTSLPEEPDKNCVLMEIVVPVVKFPLPNLSFSKLFPPLLTSSSQLPRPLSSVHGHTEPNLNLCSVFGYLLHYPVVYWFDEEQDGNCLDMEELIRYTVTIRRKITNGLLCDAREKNTKKVK